MADRVMIDAQRLEVFSRVLREFERERVPFVVGGAFALGHYTRRWRDTKDMDLFLVQDQAPRGMGILNRLGFRTWVEAEHWLAKGMLGDSMVDLIYGFGNWAFAIDQQWIDRAHKGIIFDVPVLIAPPEETILSKAFVAHRERYDGADIVHLILSVGRDLDWDHLLARFGEDWELLLEYLLLFRYVYPSQRDIVPARVMNLLLDRVKEQLRQPEPVDNVCRGTLLDRYQFVYDIDENGYRDPREEIAMSRGWNRTKVIEDRRKARQMLETGQVRPREC